LPTHIDEKATVSCVMPTTAKRAHFVPWAIEYWLSQRYPNKELVVVTDGPDCEFISGIVRGLKDSRVRQVHLGDTPIPLGMKYNLCVGLAGYNWIALWADDDWHAPHRLRYTMAALEDNPGKEIAGLRKMLFHQMGTNRTYLYQYSDDDPYFLGGSLVFHRDYWQRHKFAEQAARCADASFTNNISREEYQRVALVLRDERFYVAMNHTDNTGRDGTIDPSGPRWSRWPGSLADLMEPGVATRYTTS